MRVRLRAISMIVSAAALAASSAWGASAAFGAPGHAVKRHLAVFSTVHVRGVRGLVLAEGKGLVVYTFRGDRRGHRGTCTGPCAAIWPPVRGTPVLAKGVRIKGKFGTINGQVTFNGWPLYLFTGEKPKTNHADSTFPVVLVKTGSASAPPPAPSPSPTPAPW